MGMTNELALHMTIAVIGLWKMGPSRRETSLNSYVHLGLAPQQHPRVEELGKEFGSDVHFTSYDETLLSDFVGGSVISARFSSHEELVRKALTSGKKVLVEKPLDADATDLRGLVEAIEGIDEAGSP